MTRIKSTPMLMKEYNTKRVYNMVRMGDPLSRADLAKATGLSATSVGRIIGQLIEDGYVQEIGELEGHVGRKATLLNIVPQRVLAIGVDIDNYYIQAGLVDIGGNILQHVRCDNFAETSPEYILELVKSCIDKILNNVSQEEQQNINGIGVNVLGPTDYERGLVIQSPQFNWINVPVKTLLQNDYNYEVIVENNTKAVAKGLKILGNAMNMPDYLVVYLGSGIGSALMRDNRIVRGANNLAGEIGHIVVDPGGALCDCGRRGCLQATACTRAVEARMGMPFEQVVAGYKNGDSECVKELDRVATTLSMWFANLANLYDTPEIFVLGEMVDQWDGLIEQICVRHKRFLWTNVREALSITATPLGNVDMSLLAAAANVFYEFLLPEVSVH